MSSFTWPVLISRPCPSISVADSSEGFSLNIFLCVIFTATPIYRPEEMHKGMDGGVYNRQRGELKPHHFWLGQREDATLMDPLIPRAGPSSLLGRHVGCQSRPLGQPVTCCNPSDGVWVCVTVRQAASATVALTFVER